MEVTSEKTYAESMTEAMAIMHRDMAGATRTGDPDRDFVALMIPHHQGAIDMARIVLLHGRDPELRTLAQQIVTEQQNEIRQMRAWLKRRSSNQP